MDVVKELVSCVARAFYEPKLIIALDYINQRESVKDAELALYMRVNVKEAHKIAGKLKESKLIKSATRMEAIRPELRALARTYYYMDYKHFVDVIKWKMWKMQRLISERMQTEVDRKGYVCPNCRTSYDPIDILHLINPETGLFYCEACQTELVENTATDPSQQNQEALSRLMEDCRPIINLLKKTDSLIIPATDFVQSVKASEKSEEEAAKARARNNDTELSFARDTGAGAGDITIVFEDEQTSEEARRAQEAELEKKRQQNALPAWHMYSTVSGVKTDTAKRPGAIETGNPYSTGLPTAADSLPSASHEDHIAKYYAELEKATPTPENSQATMTPGSALLYSALSREDSVTKFNLDGSSVGTPSAAMSTASGLTPAGTPQTTGTGTTPRPVDEEPDDGGTDDFDDAELPTVKVNRQDVPLDQISDDHLAQMTPEEYTEYWKVFQEYC